MPGSPEAVKIGCTCPVDVNHQGRRAPTKDESWWVDEECVVHDVWWAAATGKGEADG